MNYLNILENWDGEIERLRGAEDQIASDAELCERVFMSRQEAFCAGLALAEGWSRQSTE